MHFKAFYIGPFFILWNESIKKRKREFQKRSFQLNSASLSLSLSISSSLITVVVVVVLRFYNSPRESCQKVSGIYLPRLPPPVCYSTDLLSLRSSRGRAVTFQCQIWRACCTSFLVNYKQWNKSTFKKKHRGTILAVALSRWSDYILQLKLNHLSRFGYLLDLN